MFGFEPSKKSTNFQDSFNSLKDCGEDIESTTHYFFHCSVFVDERQIWKKHWTHFYKHDCSKCSKCSNGYCQKKETARICISWCSNDTN